MNLLALPRISTHDAAAIRQAVLTGMNGVSPEIRGTALRTLRRAVRAGKLAPEAVLQAAQDGDAGLARLFPANALRAPALPRASAIPRVPVKAGVAWADCRWFVELAMRRGCADPDLVGALSSTSPNVLAVAPALISTWNRLLASYKPDWLPDALPGSESARLHALPAALCDPYSTDGFERDGGSVLVEPRGVSRLLLDHEAPDFNELVIALRQADMASSHPFLWADPITSRDTYLEIAVGFEVLEDIENHIRWAEGSAQPVIDWDGIRVLLEGFDYEPEYAEWFVEAILHNQRLARSAPATDAQLNLPEASPQDSAYRVAARHIAAIAAASKADASKGRLDSESRGYSAPLVILTGSDGQYDPVQQTIDQEFESECAPGIMLHAGDRKASKLDAHMQRFVTDMLVADLVYYHALMATTDPKAYLQLWSG